MQHDQLDWDDLRVFLALMRASSLRQAAEQLGMSHPTVRRRLDGLEERLRLHLFDRRPDGLHPTVQGQELLDVAEGVENAVEQLSRRAMATDPELRGPLRVTLPDILATDLLMPDFAAFCERWPHVDLGVDVSYGLADLGKREADVAIRVMRLDTLPDERLAGRKAVTAYAATYGSGDHWIGWQGAAADASWVKDTEFPDLPVRGAINHPLLQRAACHAGMGLARLPCFLAEPGLTRVSDPVPNYDIWVLVHPDLRRNPRLRAFRDAMVEALQGYEPRLQGRA